MTFPHVCYLNDSICRSCTSSLPSGSPGFPGSGVKIRPTVPTRPLGRLRAAGHVWPSPQRSAREGSRLLKKTSRTPRRARSSVSEEGAVRIWESSWAGAHNSCLLEKQQWLHHMGHITSGAFNRTASMQKEKRLVWSTVAWSHIADESAFKRHVDRGKRRFHCERIWLLLLRG